jgi:hypothetical protein
MTNTKTIAAIVTGQAPVSAGKKEIMKVMKA